METFVSGVSTIWKYYDERGNLIHYKDSGGEESWSEYDSNDNLIHHKSIKPDGKVNEHWNTYDEKGNWIYCECSDGFKIIRKYDSNNNMIYYFNNIDRIEEFYNSDGEEITKAEWIKLFGNRLKIE